MAQLEPIDNSQPKNNLSAIAEAERKKLFAKNQFSPAAILKLAASLGFGDG